MKRKCETCESMLKSEGTTWWKLNKVQWLLHNSTTLGEEEATSEFRYSCYLFDIFC